MRPCDDPLVNEGLEEEVLSSQMGGLKVTSLRPEYFTSALRGRLYALMREGVPYDQLRAVLHAEGLSPEDLLYIADVYQCPQIPKGQRMKEAVEELKRLHHMRILCMQVDAWRRRAPGLFIHLALADLRAIVRSVEKDLPSTGPDTGQPSPAAKASAAPSPSPQNGHGNRAAPGGAGDRAGRPGRRAP